MVFLPQKFYRQKTLKVAKSLLGCRLVKNNFEAVITETEAYCGPADLASHASRGRTARTAVMFGPAGFWYVYLIYGIHYCLNIVTENKDYPAAVLIRAARPLKGFESVRLDGPGRLTRAFGIDKSFNKTSAFEKKARLAIKPGKSPKKIITAPRIGVDYAGEYREKPWRFIWG